MPLVATRKKKKHRTGRQVRHYKIMGPRINPAKGRTHRSAPTYAFRAAEAFAQEGEGEPVRAGKGDKARAITSAKQLFTGGMGSRKIAIA